ncbi:MAG: hypothetical protein CM15mP109_12990 [Candidatus Dadabacteria bacterium]|nr:MAG: hypothetical protein CM15mP109_12990 [Candidatus Dadabacteria bacterium]
MLAKAVHKKNKSEESHQYEASERANKEEKLIERISVYIKFIWMIVFTFLIFL